MCHRAPRLRSAIFILFGLYLFVYPWSILLIALDWVPVWGTWMGGALLIIQGTMMGLWLVANYGRYGLLASLLILLISGSIEHTGTVTGFPFGSYQYTDVLVPKVFDVLPLAIPFAWLLVVPAAIGTTERLLYRGPLFPSLTQLHVHSSRSKMWFKVMGAAAFALLLDLTIEPVAVHINGYWVWDYSEVGYYGVPISNFVGWWITAVLLVWLLLLLQRASVLARYTPHPRPVEGSRFHGQPTRFKQMCPWLPPLLYLLNLTMFVLVNIAHAHVAAATIGGLILCYLGFDWLKPMVVRRSPTSRQETHRIMRDIIQD
jgi:bisanhydrobacterioruberin hydratase